MKTLLVAIVMMTSGLVQAAVISEKTVVLPVDVSTAKLKFTNLGYSSFLVKVIVPELITDTILNHRNVGEDGPCLFTYGAMRVEDVIQDRPEIIETEFLITLNKEARIVGDQCEVELTETVTADIRGFHFQHSKSIALPSRVVADCE